MRKQLKDATFDSIETNMEAITYDIACMRTPIDTVVYRHLERKADRLNEQGEKLHEIANRPRRRKILGIF